MGFGVWAGGRASRRSQLKLLGRAQYPLTERGAEGFAILMGQFGQVSRATARHTQTDFAAPESRRLSRELLRAHPDLAASPAASHKLRASRDRRHPPRLPPTAATAATQLTNVLSFIAALLGTSFVVRRFGLAKALTVFPTLMTLAVVLSFFAPHLYVLFVSMALLKASSRLVADGRVLCSFRAPRTSDASTSRVPYGLPKVLCDLVRSISAARVAHVCAQRAVQGDALRADIERRQVQGQGRIGVGRIVARTDRPTGATSRAFDLSRHRRVALFFGGGAVVVAMCRVDRMVLTRRARLVLCARHPLLFFAATRTVRRGSTSLARGSRRRSALPSPCARRATRAGSRRSELVVRSSVARQ